MNIITRAEAKAHGFPRYFTGKPCKYGHVSERASANGCCLACNADRMACWRKENPDKAKAVLAKWSSANPLKVRAKNAQQYAKNRAARCASAREYHRKNPEIRRKNYAQWCARNPDKVRAYCANRRSLRLAAIPPTFGEFDRFVMQEAAAACVRRAAMHGEPFQIDHMVPLSRGGLHCATNVQVIPRRLNLWKNNRLVLTKPGEWIAYA
ncbi:MAG TPA: hypothetical protein VJM50_23800 [Pyrinomonadaceae bacterium]|nr:hypothetical protein [Pyrinomonadaceae bacterium]